MALDQYGALLVVTWWYWVSRGRYWLILGETGWYMVVLGQHNSVLLSIMLYWVSKLLVCYIDWKKRDLGG